MSTRARGGRDSQTNQAREDGFRLAPMARAIALTLAAGYVVAPAYAQAQARPFGSGWMAAKGAVQAHVANTGTLPNGMLAGVNSAARQQQQSRQQLNRSVANLGRTAQAIAAQQAAQAAARQAALNNDPSVARWSGRRRPKGRHQQPDGRLAQCQGA